MKISNDRILEVVNLAIDKLVNDKERSMEMKHEDCSVVLDVTKRQININVYSLKKNQGLPFAMVDEELAMVKFDLRTKQYIRELNSSILKDSVLKILTLYRTGKLNLDV